MRAKTSRKRIKLEEPVKVQNILKKVFKDLNLDEKIKDYQIMQLWEVFCENLPNPDLASKLSKYSFAHRINNDRSLIIGVKAAVLANELQFIKTLIEAEFIKTLSQEDLPEIKKLVFELRG